MRELLWLIPVLPFLGALLNGVLLRGRIGKRAVAWIACGVVGARGGSWRSRSSPSYLGQPARARRARPSSRSSTPGSRPGRSPRRADGVQRLPDRHGLPARSAVGVMLFVVTFVGFLIHVYSIGYMAHETGFQRYFTYLNLFMFAMLMLVLGDNYLVMFVGWEGVGLCSYLLIGFYYKEEFPPDAGRKAFIVNRIGDFGFVLGLFALVSTFGTLQATPRSSSASRRTRALTGARPTSRPVARRLHRPLPVRRRDGQDRADPALRLAARRHGRPDAGLGADPRRHHGHRRRLHGGALERPLPARAGDRRWSSRSSARSTALFAATIGLAQNDIKKVLAYSTVSQLGYMFLAAGVGAYTAAIFHLMTHAFFKALLFLGSGSVIHAMGGEQDMRKMGGLEEVPAGDLLDVRDRRARDRRHPAARRLLHEGRDPARRGGGRALGALGGRAADRAA